MNQKIHAIAATIMILMTTATIMYQLEAKPYERHIDAGAIPQTYLNLVSQL